MSSAFRSVLLSAHSSVIHDYQEATSSPRSGGKLSFYLEYIYKFHKPVVYYAYEMRFIIDKMKLRLDLA